MESGVFILSRKNGVAIIPAKVKTSAKKEARMTAVESVTATFLNSFLAKYFAISTPIPTLKPVKKPKIQATIKLLAPIEAAASFPSSLPAKIRSTVLYNCWMRLPTKRGAENRSSCFPIDPSVKSCVFPDFCKNGAPPETM